MGDEEGTDDTDGDDADDGTPRFGVAAGIAGTIGGILTARRFVADADARATDDQ